jgi:gluconokinase
VTGPAATFGVVLMGVAGSGKTTLGQALSGQTGRPFVDGDDLHGAEARARMAAGLPLEDQDRWPWLDRIAERLAQGDGVIIACSALKRIYRGRLRETTDFHLVYCAIEEAEALRRIQARTGHYFPPALLASQFAILEQPAPEEGAFFLDPGGSIEVQAAGVARWLLAPRGAGEGTRTPTGCPAGT